MSKTSINKCLYSGREIEPDAGRCSHYGGRSDDSVNNKICTSADEVPDKAQREEKSYSSGLYLKKQDFFQAKLFSLLLYAIFMLILPAIGLQVISVYESSIICYILGTTALLVCLAVHFSALYHVNKFVNNNFEASGRFRFVMWGLSMSVIFMVVFTEIFIFSYTSMGKDLKIIVPVLTIFSFICFGIFNVLLYKEIYTLIDDFVEEPYDPLDYNIQEVFIHSTSFDEIVWNKLSIPFRIPAHLFRIFSEAESYAEVYGYAETENGSSVYR